MAWTSKKTFALRGEFVGFIETAEGKRRMLVRIDGADVPFKLPRELRRDFAGRLAPGQRVAVDGIERRDFFSGASKRVIEHLHLLDDAGIAATACVKCPIRICSKKNCWRSGGRELWYTFQQEIAARGLCGLVHLQAVGCLDYCKHAPNMAHGETHYRRCTRATAVQLLDRLGLR